MNEEYLEVDFKKYCKTCKHKELGEKFDPCNECLDYGYNLNSQKPMKWEEKKKSAINMTDIWRNINPTLKPDFVGCRKIFLKLQRAVVRNTISYLHMTNPKRSPMSMAPMIFIFTEAIALME